MTENITRRTLLTAATLLPLAACATTPNTAETRTTTAQAPEPDPRCTELEQQFGARLGIYALSTGTGRTLTHRADERFAFCSTFKALAAAAVLHHNPLTHLDKPVTVSKADIRSISPVTERRVDTAMTIGELCDAAVRYSDGTAGNLLLDDIGGPAGLTGYLRGLGDTVSRMDQYEPELNRDPPGDDRDTTTPRAIAADYQHLILGSALPEDKRAILTDWLVRNMTGAKRIAAAAPAGWTIADKTGTGDYGRANDIAIVWPTTHPPLVLAIMSDRSGGYDAEPSSELIAEAARHVFSTLV
ncbi:class A beta-lactamase [Nocardia sp. NPDC052316]|uniref:class A beta-lactamase n=1 Tax=Nocardia sp. NPDC052316 TaxID=3364329 RepID=UPI0037C85D7E